MEIKGIENMTYEQLYDDINFGGQFVVFTYVISIVIMTFKRPSKTIYYVKSTENSIKYGWKYLIITLLFGWWGIPFGPIYSIGSIDTAFSGEDITDEVLEALTQNTQY